MRVELSWIKSLAKKLFGSATRSSRRQRSVPGQRPAWRPGFELLEDRIVPTLWVVTSATDSASPSTGMLRYAINNSAAGDTIEFSSSLSASTITLTSALTIGHNLTIIGTGVRAG